MYKNYYGFSDYPFTLTPDLRFLFLAISHYEALASMLEGVRERKGITLITGEPGTGKTTLIHALLKGLSDKIKTAFVYHSTIEFPELLKEVLQELGVPARGNSLPKLLSLFGQYLEERLTQEETLVVIIDEAQNLGVEAIRNLFSFSQGQTPAAKVVQIVVVGQTELETKLDSPELQAFSKQITIRRRIHPLNPKECEEYINHRLKIVGSSSDKIFTQEAIARISQFSGGIPRVINLLCDNALIDGCTNRSKIDERIAEKTIQQMDYLQAPPSGKGKDTPPRASLSSIKRMISHLGLGRFPNLLDFPQNQTSFLNVVLFFLIMVSFGLGALHFLGWGQKLQVIKDGKEKGRPAEKPGERIVLVKEGWSLSFMAKEYYHAVNPTLVDLILQFNPQIKNLNLIFVDQHIRLPSLTEELFLIETPHRTCKIYLGTFHDKRMLKAFQDSPVLRNKKIEIISREFSPQVIWLRVIAGEFRTKEEGLRALGTLKQQGLLPAFAGSLRQDRRHVP